MAQAHRFHLGSSAAAAFEHSIPHGVVSQVLRPDMAAFMDDKRVVNREDEQCCIDTATFITDESPLCTSDVEYLAQLPGLVRFSVEDKWIGAGVLGLAAKRLTRLTHLNMNSCDGVDAAGLAEVATLTQLRRLELTDCEAVDAAALAQIARLTELEFLNLSSCDGVDAAGLAEVGKLSQLQHLDLSGCGDGVQAPGLAHLTPLVHLTHLNVNLSYRIDLRALEEIGKLSRLRHLDLRACGNGIDAAGLGEVAKLRQLRHLYLSGCGGVDRDGLAHVAKLSQLQHLMLSGCSGVDVAGIAELAGLRQLRRLDLHGCSDFDAAAFAGFVSSCRVSPMYE